MISTEWIESLFDLEYSTYSPLDFRVTAAAQFRLVAHSCAKQMKQVKEMQEYLLAKRIVTPQSLSVTSLKNQVDAFFEKLIITMLYSYGASAAHDYLSGILSIATLASGLRTNALQIIRPNSNQSMIISNFYPRYDNATFEQVRT